jgi:uncharacterized protein (TIGR03437 family)
VLEDLRFEVDGYAAPALHLVEESPAVWVANAQLPPGMAPGWREVRLRVGASGFSNPARIAIDVPAEAAGELAILGVSDGVSWKPGEVALAEKGGFLSCWVKGLGENADRGNVRLTLGKIPLEPTYVGAPDASGVRQVNAPAPAWMEKGERPLVVRYGGLASPSIPVTIC